MNSLQSIAKAIGILLLATTAIVALVSVLVIASDFVLLIFLGILLSVFLTKTSTLSNRYLPLGYSWNLGLVTMLLLLTLLGCFTLFGNRINDRLQATSHKLDEGAGQLIDLARDYPLAMNAFQRVPFAKDLLEDRQRFGESHSQGQSVNANRGDEAQTVNNQASSSPSSGGNSVKQQSSEVGSSSDETEEDDSSRQSNSSDSTGPSASAVQSVAGKVFSVFSRIVSTTLGLVANIGIILFVGIFIAVDPVLYRNGFARLFPLDRRERVREVLDLMGTALFSWLMGRFMTMLITGGGTAGALFMLGVPMAVTVGVITGLLTFVPNIGGFVALFLAMLMALPQGLSTVGWVVGLYAALQLLESNVITPVLQQRQTAIPPALLISFQAIMGAIAGFLGLMVATPLLAASLVLVQQAWIQDVLGESQVDS